VKIELSFEHALPIETVRERLEARARYWAEKKPALGIAGAYRWVSPARAEGAARGGRGWVEITEAQVRLGGELPFFARPFRGRIEAFLRDEATAVLSAPA
jgi:hypothetical protein